MLTDHLGIYDTVSVIVEHERNHDPLTVRVVVPAVQLTTAVLGYRKMLHDQLDLALTELEETLGRGLR